MAKTIFVEIIGNASQFKKELTSAVATTEKANTGFARMGKVAGIAGLALAGGLAIGLEKSVKAAIEAEQSTAKLNQAFANAGLSASDYSKQIDAAEASNRKLGFADHETEASLGSLITATHNVGAATRDMSVAIDVARFKHIDLEAATKTLTMAMAGSKRALTALGVPLIAITKNVDALKASNLDLSTASGKAELAHAKLLDKMATGQAIIQATSDRIHGQGQAFADTAAGGMAQFSAQLNHLEVEIGTVLIPTLTQLLGKATEFVTALNQNLGPAVKQTADAMSHLGFVATGVAVVFKYSANIYNVLKVELLALNLAIRAGTAAYNAIRTAASAVAAFFSGVLDAAIGVVHGAMSGFESAVNGVKTALNAVHTAASAVAGFVRGGLSGALNAFKGVANAVAGVVNAIAGALNAAAGAARALAGALSSIHVPSISLPHIGLPHIPGTATGGIVTGPQIRLVGEAGPEAIIPLSKGGMGGGGDTYNFSFPHYVGSQRELVDMVRNAVVQAGNRNGGNMFGGRA